MMYNGIALCKLFLYIHMYIAELSCYNSQLCEVGSLRFARELTPAHGSSQSLQYCTVLLLPPCGRRGHWMIIGGPSITTSCSILNQQAHPVIVFMGLFCIRGVAQNERYCSLAIVAWHCIWVLLWNGCIRGVVVFNGRYTPSLRIVPEQQTFNSLEILFFISHICELCIHLVFRNSWCKVGTHRVIFVPKFCYNCAQTCFVIVLQLVIAQVNVSVGGALVVLQSLCAVSCKPVVLIFLDG